MSELFSEDDVSSVEDPQGGASGETNPILTVEDIYYSETELKLITMVIPSAITLSDIRGDSPSVEGAINFKYNENESNTHLVEWSDGSWTLHTGAGAVFQCSFIPEESWLVQRCDTGEQESYCVLGHSGSKLTLRRVGPKI